MKIVIPQKYWEKIANHSVDSFPHESVGFFICIRLDNRDILVYSVKPCKNVSREKSVMSEVSSRDIAKISKEARSYSKKLGGFINFSVGQYHSHPTSGKVTQSDLDRNAGKYRKEYRMQIIVGLKSKNKRKIKTKFYYLDEINKKWKSCKIEIAGS